MRTKILFANIVRSTADKNVRVILSLLLKEANFLCKLHQTRSSKVILGHKDQGTTQRYAHLQDDPVKAVADRTSATIAAAMVGKPRNKVPN
jgi:hypothetical protein